MSYSAAASPDVEASRRQFEQLQVGNRKPEGSNERKEGTDDTVSDESVSGMLIKAIHQ